MPRLQQKGSQCICRRTGKAPPALNLGFYSVLQVPAHFSQGKEQGLGSPLHDGVYAIMIVDVPIMIMLIWTDIGEDDISSLILRKLDATVTFDSAWQGKSQKKLESLNPTILTSYVRVYEAGGYTAYITFPKNQSKQNGEVKYEISEYNRKIQVLYRFYGG